MDVIKLTRELGAAIQQDERYLNFTKARIENEEDPQLSETLGQLQLIQLNFQQEQAKETPDTSKLEKLNADFEKLYTEFAANEKVQAFERARHEVDDLMNYIMQILSLSVNGEDPMTCEPQMHSHECGCDCSSCSGC